VEWQKFIEGALGSSPIALVLGFAVWTLWSELKASRAETKAANDARIHDLLELAKRDDL